MVSKDTLLLPNPSYLLHVTLSLDHPQQQK